MGRSFTNVVKVEDAGWQAAEALRGFVHGTEPDKVGWNSTDIPHAISEFLVRPGLG